jgi:hypothetical protein
MTRIVAQRFTVNLSCPTTLHAQDDFAKVVFLCPGAGGHDGPGAIAADDR